MQNPEQKISRKKKVSFIDLLQPHQVFSIDEKFEIYRWMVISAQKYNKGIKGDNHAIALLSCSSAHGFGLFPARFYSDWDKDITLRFQYALLSQFARTEAIRWREEQGININITKILPIRYYSDLLPNYPETNRMNMDQILDAIFGFKGLKLKNQFNPCHEKANTILDVSIGVYPDYNLCIHYGYEEEFGIATASSWPKDIPSVKDELFWDWLNRNYLILKDLVVNNA